MTYPKCKTDKETFKDWIGSPDTKVDLAMLECCIRCKIIYYASVE